MQTQQEQDLARLREEIESVVGRKMKTPKDFDFLAGQIFDKLHENVSSTTLKRIWGYLSEPSTPRLSTLDILARYLDYQDWDAFCRQELTQHESTSVPPKRRFISWRTLVPLAVVVIALLVGGVIFLSDKNKNDKGELIHGYILKRGTHFDKPQDYLELFGIHDLDFYWGRQIPNYPGIFIWGPEYGNPSWGNEGDSAAMMPTISEHWASKYADSTETIQKNRELYHYYMSMRRDELRITFMKNLVDTGYVFLGVYRLSESQSDTTHTVWERVQDDLLLHNLDSLKKYRN